MYTAVCYNLIYQMKGQECRTHHSANHHNGMFKTYVAAASLGIYNWELNITSIRVLRFQFFIDKIQTLWGSSDQLNPLCNQLKCQCGVVGEIMCMKFFECPLWLHALIQKALNLIPVIFSNMQSNQNTHLRSPLTYVSMWVIPKCFLNTYQTICNSGWNLNIKHVNQTFFW